MSRWENFHIWRGRLPHWRASDVTYYVTFRHSRELSEEERHLLLTEMLKLHGRHLDFSIVCILPGATECLFTTENDEFSDFIEKAKRRTGKKIVKQTNERWPPFYNESYDRIMRDDEEYETTFLNILESPIKADQCEDPEEWEALFVPAAPAG